MTKKIIDVVLDDNVKYSLDGLTLEKALHQIKEWIQQHGGKATLDIGQEYEDYGDNEYAYVRIYGRRLETDEEYTNRLDDEQAYKNKQERREREQYEALQKKYASMDAGDKK